MKKITVSEQMQNNLEPIDNTKLGWFWDIETKSYLRWEDLIKVKGEPTSSYVKQ